MSGDVSVLQVRISTDGEEGDRYLLDRLLGTRADIKIVIERMVQAELGPEFYVRDMVMSRGSVLLTIVLAVGNAVIFYDEFLSGLERIRANIHGFFNGKLDTAPVTITSSWAPGHGVISPVSARHQIHPAHTQANQVLLGYLILSHAALLAFLLWVAARR